MINGEETGEATGEVASPDPFGSFPTLRVRESDRGDASPPSSRYSSCGESEFDRYCSANSVMGTPSMCSTITVFNDFTEYEFGSTKSFGIGDDNGLENFSLGGRVEMNRKDQRLSTSDASDSTSDFRTGFCSENIRNQQYLKYGSSGLELYGDDNDELTMTRLDASSLMGVNQLDKNLGREFVNKDDVEGSEACKGHNELGGAGDYFETLSSDEGDNAGNSETYLLSNVDEMCYHSATTVGEGDLSCAAGKGDEFNSFDAQSNLQIGERETEREADGNSSNCEQSEGEDSMYNYDGDDDNKNDFCIQTSIHHHEESKVQNENPLLINTSVAFGSEDLDDYLLENEGNGQVSQMFDAFHSQKGKNHEVDENSIKNSTGFSIAGQKEEGTDRKAIVIFGEKVEKIKDHGEPEEVKVVSDFAAASNQVQGDDELTNITESSSNASGDFPNIVIPQQEDVREIFYAKNSCPNTCSISKANEVGLDPLAEEAPQHMGLNVTDGEIIENGNEFMNTEEAIGSSHVQHVENPELDKSKFKFDHFSDSKAEHNFSSLTKQSGNINEESTENLERVGLFSNHGMRKTLDSSSTSTNLFDKSPLTSQTENFELNEFCDEVVHEMEEILLDSVDSPGARLAQGNRFLEPQFSMALRDGGLTASTSGTNDAYLLVQHPMRIDRIEVVGARQEKGDVSFSERLVGVKEYTLYKLKVWSSKDQWEVERRYRDFLTLYRRMKTLFTEQGWVLPLPWSLVEKESKKIFGSASPDIIMQRSVLIQECLQSILHTRLFSSPPSALIWFLSPQDSYPSSPASNSLVSQSPLGTNNGNLSTLGKTISLIVEIPPQKSMKQMLEAQHNTCAGCHKHFDDGKTLIRDFVETFGWGKPRICEYTGQLFCSSCHTNEIAVLPARVLHHWDFTQYPVSQLAKSYLDSIHDQPMLCVTAVNPFLLTKVPALLHVMNVRKKIRTMLPYVRCPFRRSINRGLGTRRYVLESNDFFALRDLIDLSKGAFAALPVMVETLSTKILEHITDQCLICCDVGVPCGARQDCSDPSALIFPFQEDEIERCTTCQSVFHKRCFRKLRSCPCGALLRLDATMSLTNRVSRRGSGETSGTLDLLGRGTGSGLSSTFLSGFFTKEKPQKTKEHKDENIILMGSLPSTSL